MSKPSKLQDIKEKERKMKLASFKISKERVLLNWQLKATVSVEIVGTFYCLLDDPLNVGAQIW